MRRLALALALAMASGPALAQTALVTSARPDHVALTVYRAPYGRGAIDLHSLRGFAMVTETRRVRVPRGRAVIRFEGVAEGIVPVSAIIDGLPGGTIEKNRDARLLSPASLVDGTLGRQVTLTRTDPATGQRVSEDATLVAGPTPGVVLRTAAGIETLRCSGLPERMDYAGVPPDLSSKPVLSVTTNSPAARTVTVRVTYLASGFDWRASYVATLAPDGSTLDLLAWLTLANGNPERFPEADVQAVAGRLNRSAVPMIPPEAAALRLTCYPLGTTTSDLRVQQREESLDIVVTAARNRAMPAPEAMYAAAPPPPPPPPPPEDLGDLKLYRVAEPVNVAANAQKQVALLIQAAVPFQRRYRRAVFPSRQSEAAPTTILLVMENETAAGLGVPLPTGSTALYARRGADRLLLGLGSLADRAVGETVRLAGGVSHQVQVAQTITADREAVVVATNANAFPVTLDIPIGSAGQQIEPLGAGTERKDGIVTWSPELPPGGRAELRYRY